MYANGTFMPFSEFNAVILSTHISLLTQDNAQSTDAKESSQFWSLQAPATLGCIDVS